MRHATTLVAVVVCIAAIGLTLHYRSVAKRATAAEAQAGEELKALRRLLDNVDKLLATPTALETETAYVEARRELRAISGRFEEELAQAAEDYVRLEETNERLVEELAVLRRTR